MNWEPLCRRGDVAENAWLLREGKLAFGTTEDELITMEGKNLIVGSEEFLLAGRDGVPLRRLCHWHKDSGATLTPVPPANLKALLPRFPVAQSLCVHLARLLLQTNKLYRERREKGGGDEAVYQASAKTYFMLVDEMAGIADKFRFPPLLQLVEKSRNELIHEAGRIFTHQEKTLFHPGEGSGDSLSPGTTLCEQGEEGQELFIVLSGTIDVLVGGAKVASIEEAGSVIGEIALFLGEKRTATLRVSQTARIAKVTRANLAGFCAKNPSFLGTVAMSCAKRYRNNLSLIRGYDEKHQPKPGEFQIPDFLKGKPGEDRIAAFLKQLIEIQKFKKYDPVKAFLSKHQTLVNKYSDLMGV